MEVEKEWKPVSKREQEKFLRETSQMIVWIEKKEKERQNAS